jgi:pimeloyl-ACP methyl ester carboxylesterase
MDQGTGGEAGTGSAAWRDPAVAAWAAQATTVAVGGDDVAVWDVPAAAGEQLEPLLVVHGFPTSSYDWAPVVPRLARHRRVVLFDMLGFGLSAKPDRRYTMALQADVAEAVVARLGIERLALMTHDMGDTVGGELLARSQAGEWAVEVTRRVVTNGSIYIEMAQLTDGQQMLLAQPDEALAQGVGPELMAASLVATLAPAHRDVDMAGHGELVCHGGGDAMLTRTIRYIEERRANERRFTGAIEAHPSPLHVVWGPEDPIAVAAMAERLVAARPDATRAWVDGAGHYPMVEDPDAFLAAVTPFLEA